MSRERDGEKKKEFRNGFEGEKIKLIMIGSDRKHVQISEKK